ncbi:MAG: formylmethanofuran dehydrogenase subunit B [Methylococcales symbiont of Iophon sp. n. MRB-2018]|nr:MAG: formylmethanofuran dehydrogenase subunit B [Methylococcales symbiont of Iophon sp. n. MRB-2018]KAF3978813.1 MAG: formylmethanofuran dehydrogenase subunit B [Methylococcales symbiont of Iophon sp. n. MRB-2018]
MTEITEVPSPFCGIGTDDLAIKVNGVSIKVSKNGCAVNTAAFEQAITDTSPRIDGKEVSLKQAVTRASEILRNANQPVIGGCATDVNGMRALMALADRNGAVVDNMNFTKARANFLALQDSGWMNTTLAEIKNRCDLFVVIACDLEVFAPRFYPRYLWNKESMFLDDTSAREIIYIGKAPSGKASTSPKKIKAQVLECADVDLPEVLAVLRALIKENLVIAEQVGGIAVADLQMIADKLKAATYGVVTWAAGALDFPQAELTVQTICELVKEVNASGVRCSGFPLGGKEGDQTANQVCGWQTGYPARMRFSSDIPEYDPFLYDINQMFDNGEVDAFVWVQAFNSSATPPTGGRIPTIVVARSGMTFKEEPDVFIPVGTPGIDHAGHAYRLDNVVAIRLKKLRDSGLPSTAEVLTAIEQGLVS